MTSCSASRSVRAFPGGKWPFVAVIAPASAPPSQKPRPNACRMLRTSCRSVQMKLSRRASSYEPSAVAGLAPGRTAANAASAAFAAVRPGASPATALGSYDDALRESFIWTDLQEVRNMRQAFGRGFWLGGALAGAMTATKGHFPPGNARTERDAEQDVIEAGRASSYPTPDGKLTFDKLSSVFASGNKTRDDQPNHIRVQTRVPEELGRLWERMCPAQVYEWTDGSVQVTPSNCVQCGAITAKGGRLTPPEGGSGPEYRLT